MSAWTLEHVAARLGGRAFADPAPLLGKRAAVAAVLRFDRGRPEVLLILRSERAGDRWSGQVSMPGGREEPGDPDLLATALRETREEVGLDLRAGLGGGPGAPRLLGRLEPLQAMAKGQFLPMTISPFVFALPEGVDPGALPLTLSPEATRAFWLPLDQAASGALDARHEYKLGPLPVNLPCWRWEDFVVWGLTYKMLRTLVEAL